MNIIDRYTEIVKNLSTDMTIEDMSDVTNEAMKDYLSIKKSTRTLMNETSRKMKDPSFENFFKDNNIEYHLSPFNDFFTLKDINDPLPHDFPYVTAMMDISSNRLIRKNGAMIQYHKWIDYDTVTIFNGQNSLMFCREPNIILNINDQIKFFEENYGYFLHQIKDTKLHSTTGAAVTEYSDILDITDELYYFHGEDITDIMNKKGWTMPLTDKQIFELEMKL